MSAAQKTRAATRMRAPTKGKEAPAAPAFNVEDDSLGLVAALLNGDQQVAQLYEIIRTKEPLHVAAWLRMGQAVAAGENFAAAEARFRSEIVSLEDADLFAACAEYHTAFDAAREAFEPAVSDEVWEARCQREDEAQDRVAGIPAATLAGVQAKARATERYMDMILGSEGVQNIEDRLVKDVFADLSRLGGGAGRPVTDDAELIALLQQAREMMRAPVPHDDMRTLASILAPRPWEAPLHAAAMIPAGSQAGIWAKAEAVADWIAGQDRRKGPGFACDREMAVAWSLMRDLLGPNELAPVPPPRRPWTEEDEAKAKASMPPPIVLPAVPDIAWMWGNARKAIQDLPVHGYRLSTACILEATRAADAGDAIRAHNLLMAASAAVHEQMDGLGVKIAFNTDVAPKEPRQ